MARRTLVERRLDDQGVTMERAVKVWDRPYKVEVHQTSKSVWVAAGDYEGQHISVKSRSATSAVAAWIDAARYKGNL